MSTASLRPSDGLSSDALSGQLDQRRRVREQVEALIADPALLGPDFEPIRRLDPSTPGLAPLLGWKATGRVVSGSGADVLGLLHQAASVGLVERLDWAFRAHTFDVVLEAGIAGELHLTPEPETFGTPCPPRLAVSVLRGRRALDVCAELHDDAFDHEARLLDAVEEMQGWGWHLVVADVRSSPHRARALSMLERLRPAYVQVDLSAADAGALEWVEAARSVSAAVMALRVDTTARMERALELGAVYGRGALIGARAPRPV